MTKRSPVDIGMGIKGESPLEGIKVKVQEQYQRWLNAMRTSLHGADVKTHDLLDWIVQCDDPRITLSFVSHLPADKIAQLHDPARTLVEDLRRRTDERLTAIRVQRQKLAPKTHLVQPLECPSPHRVAA